MSIHFMLKLSTLFTHPTSIAFFSVWPSSLIFKPLHRLLCSFNFFLPFSLSLFELLRLSCYRGRHQYFNIALRLFHDLLELLQFFCYRGRHQCFNMVPSLFRNLFELLQVFRYLRFADFFELYHFLNTCKWDNTRIKLRDLLSLHLLTQCRLRYRPRYKPGGLFFRIFNCPGFLKSFFFPHFLTIHLCSRLQFPHTD